MNAIHSLWTKPFYANGGKKFELDDFDILTAVLSALTWQSKNGKIKMVTDTCGYEYLAELGLLGIWNEIEVSLDEIKVNPHMFWAAGKMYALALQKAPCVMIDTDFIVWNMLDFSQIKEDIAVIHTEELYTDVYPNIEHFNMKSGYEFDSEYDWTEKACNTAFLYIKDERFLKYYTDSAIEFMKNAADCDDTLTYMVFAEQRLLPMCAKKTDKNIFVFSTLEKLFENGDNYFTHTWGFKQQMRENPDVRYDFCRRCAQRIKKDYPQYTDILSEIEKLKIYFRSV